MNNSDQIVSDAIKPITGIKDYFEFSDSWVVVTGGDRGIGRAISHEFATHGANVVILYLENHTAARETCSLLDSLGTNSKAICVDVSDYESVQKAFSKITKFSKKISVLVNGAGITQDNMMGKLTYRNWHQVINTNLTGCFNCSKAVLENMIRENYGRIINISSIIAQTGNIGQSNYAASKAGVIGFTKSVALETAGYDITINALCPGFIDTDMTKKIPSKIKKMILKKIPKGRFGLPEEVSRMTLFLASPKSGYITGQTFNINGGLYM